MGLRIQIKIKRQSVNLRYRGNSFVRQCLGPRGGRTQYVKGELFDYPREKVQASARKNWAVRVGVKLFPAADLSLEKCLGRHRVQLHRKGENKACCSEKDEVIKKGIQSPCRERFRSIGQNSEGIRKQARLEEGAV